MAAKISIVIAISYSHEAEPLADVTFCIPSFGDPKYLAETLASIGRQSTSCRAIVSFGGTAPTWLRLQAERDSWLQIVEKNPDPGMVACWEAAADASETAYLSFLADDNSVAPRFAETLVQHLELNGDAAFAFCNQQHMDANGKICDRKSGQLQAFFGRDAMQEGMLAKEHAIKAIERNSIPLESSVFRRTVWSKYRPFFHDARGAFDIEFIFRVILNDDRPYFCSQQLMQFRWHAEAYCTRMRSEHAHGAANAYSQLAASASGEFAEVVRKKRSTAELRLLRYPQKLSTRLSRSIRLGSSGYAGEVAKQNLAWILGRG